MDTNNYELQEWINALRAYDARNFDKALRVFMTIGDSAKMHFNIGVIFSIIQDHRRALAAFKRALKMDPFLAVACFQKGVSHFALGDMAEACQAFDLAHKKLRGNAIINYHQLGLAFRLYECEVLFNRGICHLHLGKIDAGLTDLYFAQKAKMTDEHGVIDQAIRDRGVGYSVYSIPPGVLFRPPEYKVQQLRGYRKNSILVPPVHQHHWTQHLPMIDTNDNTPSPSSSSSSSNPETVAAAATEARRRPKRPPAAPPLFESEQGAAAAAAVQDQPPPPLSPPPQPPQHHTTNKPPAEAQGWKFIDQRPRRPTLPTQTNGWLQPDVEKELMQDTSTHLLTPFPIPTVQHNRSDPAGAIDTMSNFGDGLDEELEKVYASLDAYIKNNDLASDAEQSSSSSSSLSSSSSSSRGKPQVRPAQPPSSKAPTEPAQPQSLQQQQQQQQHITHDQSKLKIKVHYHDTRVLVVPSNIHFDSLLGRIRAKFDSRQPLRLQYKDDENELVLMIDQDDLTMARHIARQRNASTTGNKKTPPSAAGGGGLEKLELWCVA